MWARYTPSIKRETIQRSSVVERSAVNAKRAFFASERSMSECVGNALFTQVNADFDRSWNFQRGKPPIDCRPVKMAGEKFSVCRGVASPGVRPPNKNNSTGRLHANFVGFAKNLTERKDLRARKNQDSLTPTSAILSVYAAAQSASTIPEKSIAVLPFENRSEDRARARNAGRKSALTGFSRPRL